MSRSMQIIADVKRQISEAPSSGYTEVEWITGYTEVEWLKISPTALQRVGFSHRGAKELMSGRAISSPKDRKVAALIISEALK